MPRTSQCHCRAACPFRKLRGKAGAETAATISRRVRPKLPVRSRVAGHPLDPISMVGGPVLRAIGPPTAKSLSPAAVVRSDESSLCPGCSFFVVGRVMRCASAQGRPLKSACHPVALPSPGPRIQHVADAPYSAAARGHRDRIVTSQRSASHQLFCGGPRLVALRSCRVSHGVAENRHSDRGAQPHGELLVGLAPIRSRRRAARTASPSSGGERPGRHSCSDLPKPEYIIQKGLASRKSSVLLLSTALLEWCPTARVA